MNDAFSKLVKELEEKGIKSNLKYWHRNMLAEAARLKELRKQPKSDPVEIRGYLVVIRMYQDSIRGAVHMLKSVGMIGRDTENAVQKQLEEETKDADY